MGWLSTLFGKKEEEAKQPEQPAEQPAAEPMTEQTEAPASEGGMEQETATETNNEETLQ